MFFLKVSRYRYQQGHVSSPNDQDQTFHFNGPGSWSYKYEQCRWVSVPVLYVSVSDPNVILTKSNLIFLYLRKVLIVFEFKHDNIRFLIQIIMLTEICKTLVAKPFQILILVRSSTVPVRNLEKQALDLENDCQGGARGQGRARPGLESCHRELHLPPLSAAAEVPPPRSVILETLPLFYRPGIALSCWSSRYVTC